MIILWFFFQNGFEGDLSSADGSTIVSGSANVINQNDAAEKFSTGVSFLQLHCNITLATSNNQKKLVPSQTKTV